MSIRVFDATQVPWPVDDKAYDLFMALQVFEHLTDRQREAFLEVLVILEVVISSNPPTRLATRPRLSSRRLQCL